jgi:4-amino-4-deoxy-L-arabinose transferase-like glycosyltransferase
VARARGAGAATVLLISPSAKVYSARVGLLAALLFVTSPFYLMTSSNFMSHNSGVLLVASLFCIVIADRRPFTYGVLGGLLYGLFFNTQQLSAVALIAPIGLLILSNAIPPSSAFPPPD